MPAMSYRCLLSLVAMTAVSGCAAAGRPTTVALRYEVAQNEKGKTQLPGEPIGLVPFQDARSDPYLYRQSLRLAEGQDAGVWLANAMKLELEKAGGTVEALPADAPVTSGRIISGRVCFLKAEPTGWHLGGILAALIGTGYMPHITVSVQLSEEGIPVLTRDYDIKKNVPSDAAGVILWGFPPAERDVPVAFGVVLKNLIREQILPDLAQALSERSTVSAERHDEP